MLLVMTVFG